MKFLFYLDIYIDHSKIYEEITKRHKSEKKDIQREYIELRHSNNK